MALLQAAVSLSNAVVKALLSRALMAASISPIGAIVVGFDHLADRHVLVFGNTLGDVLEQFLQFVDLIIRKLPIARVAGEPKLGVMALDVHHELDEARRIGFAGSLVACSLR